MSEIIKTIKSLPDLIALVGASAIEISNAENQLDLRFADEYKKYLTKFGAIIADGVELSGIAKSEHRNIVSLTKQEWELNPQVPRAMYVIENVGIDGIIIWQDVSGSVYQTAPHQAPRKIYASLTEAFSRLQ